MFNALLFINGMFLIVLPPFLFFDKNFWEQHVADTCFVDVTCEYFKIKFLAFELNEECKLINTIKLENILGKLIVEHNTAVIFA